MIKGEHCRHAMQAPTLNGLALHSEIHQVAAFTEIAA